MPIADPGQTYEALGAFIERRSPYANAVLPSFGPGTTDGDKAVFVPENEHMGDDTGTKFTDTHIVAEEGPYREFNREHPSDLKSECLEKEAFLHWNFDGVDNQVTKAIRIEYTHTRKADKKKCTAFILIGFTGDSH